MAISSIELEFLFLGLGPDISAWVLWWYICRPVGCTIRWWSGIGIWIQRPDIKISECTQLKMRVNIVYEKDIR